ncbi:hypothetical protein MMPV_003485 [Pyropia vietnamensis]
MATVAAPVTRSTSTPFLTPCREVVTEGPAGGCCRRQTCRRRTRPTCSVAEVPPSVDVPFIADGIVFRSARLDQRNIDWADWARLAGLLEAALGAKSDKDRAALRERIHRYYLPLFFWMRGVVMAAEAKWDGVGDGPPPVVIGISCPQGGGKSTMVRLFEALFAKSGLPCMQASLDDFYLTRAEQLALAAEHPGNALLAERGLPGTHDVGLLASTLDSLRAGLVTPIPRYDKTAFSGRGDRADATTWPLSPPGLRVILLEGWALGFSAASLSAAPLVHPDMAAVDAYTATHLAAVNAQVDALVCISAADVQYVYGWREQAEAETRARGAGGLTPEQIRAFVNGFMPCYEQYGENLRQEVAAGSWAGKPALGVTVDVNRKPITCRPIQ